MTTIAIDKLLKVSKYSRITLNNRLLIPAAAIVNRINTFNKLLNDRDDSGSLKKAFCEETATAIVSQSRVS